MIYYGQCHQDKFITQVLKHKERGFFLEIGSNDPKIWNNTYLLESTYNWKGIMIEYDNTFLSKYKTTRKNSIHVINDATKIDYKLLFKNNNMPTNVDYLQLDLEVSNGSTLQTLEKLDREIFDEYKFAVVTFEHDIYHTNYLNTREKSREIFTNRGYVGVFYDIHNIEPTYPFEDWYVHPDLVDMEYVTNLMDKNKKNYVNNYITQKSINWQSIDY